MMGPSISSEIGVFKTYKTKGAFISLTHKGREEVVKMCFLEHMKTETMLILNA